jgi:hypothetical protein
LAEVDAVLSELMQGLYLSNMMHCINIIIIADHGQSTLIIIFFFFVVVIVVIVIIMMYIFMR